MLSSFPLFYWVVFPIPFLLLLGCVSWPPPSGGAVLLVLLWVVLLSPSRVGVAFPSSFFCESKVTDLCGRFKKPCGRPDVFQRVFEVFEFEFFLGF